MNKFHALISFVILVFCGNTSSFGQICMGKACEISFFSAAALENISAVNKTSKPVMNTASGDFQVKISVRAFHFEKPLMEEHFNENYLETEKFPDAIFKGKINETLDYTKDGSYEVTVNGKFTIHGVEKERNGIKGKVTIKGSEIMVDASFPIHIADYNIKVPSLVVKNIAEDVDVKIVATLEPYKKP